MSTTRLTQLNQAMSNMRNTDQAANLSRFFKTGPGQYGEGDQFYGINVPETRKLVQQFKDLTLTEVSELLHAPIHEKRLLGLLIWVDQYRKGDALSRQQIFEAYIHNLDCVNNWDLVDSSAFQIVGAHLFGKPHDLLLKWAHSPNIWHRRIAVIATFYDIKYRHFDRTLQIAKILVHDPHDLIQKAVGWMLREIGNRDFSTETQFLDQHASHMPRTMLRYAIEKFPEPLRQSYLKGKNT